MGFINDGFILISWQFNKKMSNWINFLVCVVKIIKLKLVNQIKFLLSSNFVLINKFHYARVHTHYYSTLFSVYRRLWHLLVAQLFLSTSMWFSSFCLCVGTSSPSLEELAGCVYTTVWLTFMLLLIFTGLIGTKGIKFFL